MRRDILGVHAGAAPLFELLLETPAVIWTIRTPAIEDPIVSCFWLYSVNIDSKTVHRDILRKFHPLLQAAQPGNS